MLRKYASFLLTLVVVAACQDKGTTSESSDTDQETDSATGTPDPTETGGTEEWGPVECGAVVCDEGEYCLREIPVCRLVTPEPCGGESSGGTGTGGDDTEGDTGGGSSEEQCWEEEDPKEKCLALPADCQGTAAEIASCLDGSLTCPYGGTFTAGTYSCVYNSLDHCEEGFDQYDYCTACL